MLAEAAREVLLIAPGNKRVDQPIAATVREVVVSEAEAPQALLVMREPQVEGAGLTRHAPRLRGRALEENLLLDAEPRLGSESLARPRGVLGRYQVRVRASRAPRGKAEEARSESGKHGGGGGLLLRGGVEGPPPPGEGPLERRNGTLILTAEHGPDERRVRDAEPEDETPLRLLGERALCRRRGVGFAQEDVRDASRDMEALRCGEEPARLHEGVPPRYLRKPEGTVAEGFDPPGALGGLPRRHRVGADPDPCVPDRARAARSSRVQGLRVRHHRSLRASLPHDALDGA